MMWRLLSLTFWSVSNQAIITGAPTRGPSPPVGVLTALYCSDPLKCNMMKQTPNNLHAVHPHTTPSCGGWRKSGVRVTAAVLVELCARTWPRARQRARVERWAGARACAEWSDGAALWWWVGTGRGQDTAAHRTHWTCTSQTSQTSHALHFPNKTIHFTCWKSPRRS